MLWEKVCTNTDTHQQVQTFISLLTFTDTDAWRCPLPTLHPYSPFFQRSWAKLAQHLSTWGADSSARQIRDFSEHPCFLLFVVFACLAVVSSDDYRTHRHSSHDAVCLSDLDLPAGKVKSEQDRRRWMPLCTAPIVDFTGGGGSKSLLWIFLWICLISASAYCNIPDFPQMIIMHKDQLCFLQCFIFLTRLWF